MAKEQSDDTTQGIADDVGKTAVPSVTPKQPGNERDNGGAADGSNSAKPFFVQLVESNELRPFEEESLSIARDSLKVNAEMRDFARLGFYVALAAFLAAFAAAVFVWTQVRIMTRQTEIMASQNESAAAGGLFDQMNTRQQLHIAQTQANAAQDSVRAIQKQTREDQRAWIYIGAEGDIKVEENKPIELSVTYANKGKTGARKIREEFVAGFTKNLPSQVSFKYDGVPRQTVSTGTIWPATSTIERFEVKSQKPGINGRTDDRTVSHDEWADFVAGKIFAIVYGRIRYKDIFGIQHETRMCGWKGSDGHLFYARSCSEYNSVDNR